MALTKTVLTGRFPFANDVVPAFAVARFTPSGFDTEGPDVLFPQTVEVNLINGELPPGFDLWATIGGTRARVYRVSVVETRTDANGGMPRQFSTEYPPIAVPLSGPVEIATLFMLDTPAPVAPDVLAICIAAQESALLSATAASNEADRAEAAAESVDTAVIAAEAARDATNLIAATKGAYRDTTIALAIAQGVAALTVADTFTAAADNVDYIGLYVIEAGPVATEIAKYPTSAAVDLKLQIKDVGNLFNSATILDEHRLNEFGAVVTGAGVTDPSDFYLSEYFRVSAGETYSHTAFPLNKYVAFYTEDKTFVSSSLVTSGFTAPVGAAYARISPRKSEVPINQFMIVLGAVLPVGMLPWVGDLPPRRREADVPLGFAGIKSNGKISSALIDGEPSRNIFDKETITDGIYILPSGVAVSDSQFYSTDFIQAAPIANYEFTTTGINKYVTFWDANKVIISGGLATGTFTTPPNTAYVRISPRYSETPKNAFMVAKGALPATYQPYNGLRVALQSQSGVPYGLAGLDGSGKIYPDQLPSTSSQWEGKKIAIIGDSITYGFIPRNAPGYPGQLASYGSVAATILRASFDNYGISGSTLAYSATRNPMSRRYSLMADDADVVLLMGGTNDVRNSIALGTISDMTDATYYGALRVLAEGLLNKYRYDQGVVVGASKLIVFCTPLRLLGAPAGFDNFAQAVRDVAEIYSIPVFDAYNDSGLTPELFRTLVGTEPGYTDNYNPFVPDGTHPSLQGHVILGKRLAGFLRGKS